MSPTISPTILPTVFPTMSPTMSPSLPPNLSSTLLPTTSTTLTPSLSPNLSSTLLPTSSLSTAPPFSSTEPSTSLTADGTQVRTASCSFHPKCYAASLVGDCCPTLDGVMLGCCGNFWDEEETDKSDLESSTRGIFHYRILVVSAFSALIGYW